MLPEETKKIYLNRIRSLLVENIYSNGGEKIDINKLTKDINGLNEIINSDKQLSLTTIKRHYSIMTDIKQYPNKYSRSSKSKSKSRSRSNSKSNSKSNSNSNSNSNSRSKSRSKSKSKSKSRSNSK